MVFWQCRKTTHKICQSPAQRAAEVWEGNFTDHSGKNSVAPPDKGWDDHRQDESSLLLPCDWRFLPKLGPAAAGVQGRIFYSRVGHPRHEIFIRTKNFKRFCSVERLCNAAKSSCRAGVGLYSLTFRRRLGQHACSARTGLIRDGVVQRRAVPDRIIQCASPAVSCLRSSRYPRRLRSPRID